MLGGLKVGYIDLEDNEDDFADKLTDFDNFLVGYSHNFQLLESEMPVIEGIFWLTNIKISI